MTQHELPLDASYLSASPQVEACTPARIGVGRAGLRPLTKTWLKFRFDHATAVDAVYGEVTKSLLDKMGWRVLRTQALDHETYIRRPDLGRKLTAESRLLLKENGKQQATVQVLVSNGLSALSIEENAEDVYLSLCQSLDNAGIEVGETFYIERGRVGLMDEVGSLLQSEVIVYLIGERPGLVSADSMSVYMCYRPSLQTIESDRLVVSNIHTNGMPQIEAGAYIATLVQKMLYYKASGVQLAERESEKTSVKKENTPLVTF